MKLHELLRSVAPCRYKPGCKPPAPKRTFRNHWNTRCEGEWHRAFYMFSLGEFLCGREEEESVCFGTKYEEGAFVVQAWRCL